MNRTLPSLVIAFFVMILPVMASGQDITLPPDGDAGNAPPPLKRVRTKPRWQAADTEDPSGQGQTRGAAVATSADGIPRINTSLLGQRRGLFEMTVGLGLPQFDGDTAFSGSFSGSLLFFPSGRLAIGIYVAGDMLLESYFDDNMNSDMDMSAFLFSAGAEGRFYLVDTRGFGLWAGAILGVTSVNGDVSRDYDSVDTLSGTPAFLSLGAGILFRASDYIMGFSVRYRKTFWDYDRFTADFISLEAAFVWPF